MVDIQSLTAEIRQGKKRKKKPQHENIYGLPYYIGGQKQLLSSVYLFFSCKREYNCVLSFNRNGYSKSLFAKSFGLIISPLVS